jgi:GTP-binding protein HflX
MGCDLVEFLHSVERAVLVHLLLSSVEEEEDEQGRREFRELVLSAGAECVTIITGRRQSPDPRLFVGLGKADEIREAVLQSEADMVIFNHALAPRQERNLAIFLKCRVLDRTALILDIFARLAHSFEGKLQVELAQLNHLSNRLVRGWTHLERQRGGIGLRGPGETQLETDRRLISNRIRQIKTRLERVDHQRAQGRRARRKANLPTVSVVGYTNAGKSTLFNVLTKANVYVANQLFSTLDPTLRRFNIPGAGRIILTDTVGFISDLPHELVAAFRATLREICEAGLLLHVIDANHSDRTGIITQVESVLEDIGATNVPRLQVFNKIDLTGDPPHLERDAAGKIRAVWLSSISGAGIELLIAALSEWLLGDTVHCWLCLPPEAARLRARLFDLGAVISEQDYVTGDRLIEIQTSHDKLDFLKRYYGLRAEWMRPICAILQVQKLVL